MDKNVCIFVTYPRSSIIRFPEERKQKHLDKLGISEEDTQFILLKADLRIPSREKAIQHILTVLGETGKLSIQYTPGMTYQQKDSAKVLLHKLFKHPQGNMS